MDDCDGGGYQNGENFPKFPDAFVTSSVNLNFHRLYVRNLCPNSTIIFTEPLQFVEATLLKRKMIITLIAKLK